MSKKRRTVYVDGWHVAEEVDFLVENGALIRGIDSENRNVVPYQYDKRFGCWVNVSGIRATYGVLNRVEWH